MSTDIGDVAEIICKDFETIRDDKRKRSKGLMSLITEKVKPKNSRQDEGAVSLFMEKAQALGFSFEERQKLFLLYGGHL